MGTIKWTPPRPALRVWTNGTDWWIAESPGAARAGAAEHYGIPETEEELGGEDGCWSEHTASLLVTYEDEDDLQRSLREAIGRGCDTAKVEVGRVHTDGLHYLCGEPPRRCYLKASAEWWIRASGEGFLCSTEW